MPYKINSASDFAVFPYTIMFFLIIARIGPNQNMTHQNESDSPQFKKSE